jgi:tetratricopeptide (TPR) repeat protein
MDHCKALIVAAAALLVAGAASAQEDSTAAVAKANGKLLAYATKEARDALAPVTDKAGSDARVALALGRVLEQEKKYPEAIASLQKAAALAPADPAPQVFLGEIYLRQKKQKEAEAAFRKGLDLAKASSGFESGYYQGVAQLRLKQYDTAVASLKRVLEAKPGHPETLHQLGVATSFQQKWEEAAGWFDQALANDATLAYAYYYRGLAQDKRGKKDLAVADMNRFLKVAPAAPEAALAKAYVAAASR